MPHHLFLILVVLFRTTGVYLIANGMLAWASGLLVSRGALGIPWLAMLLPVIGGIVLWLLARPAATLITKDLG